MSFLTLCFQFQFIVFIHLFGFQKSLYYLIKFSPGFAYFCLTCSICFRYESTISASFFGHTHKDEFELYYDEDTTRPVGVGFIGPSVTTYTSLNPGYRIYYVDGDREGSSRTVLNHETWVLDLEQSNKNRVAVWFKSYSAKEEYQMSSLGPDEWDKLYQRLKTNDDLLQTYYR